MRLFAQVGTITVQEGTRTPDILFVRAGAPFPRFIGDLLFAEEGSIIDPPDDLPIVWLKVGAPFPVLAEPTSDVA